MLLREEVTDEDVARVVATWTGIPVTRLQEGERSKLSNMEDRLRNRVVVQPACRAGHAPPISWVTSGTKFSSGGVG